MTGHVHPTVLAEAELRGAILSSLTVSLSHRDGRRLVGVPHEHPTDTEYFVLHMGGRSGTREIHYDDVLAMSVEC